MEVVVTTGAVKVVQSSSQIITNNKTTSIFYKLGCPSCHPQPTVLKHRRENITFHGLAYPKLSSSEGLSTLSLTTNALWVTYSHA